MCTHNQCFEQKRRKYYNFSSENYCLYSREILLYIAWVCLRNVFRIETLERDGVRFVFRENNTFANDAEPDYIAYNADETKAYICLQVTACYHDHEVYTASNLTFK